MQDLFWLPCLYCRFCCIIFLFHIWLNLLEITRTQVTLAGETAQAAPLLRIIDASPLFQGSEFAIPPSRVNTAEAFRIRTQREPGR